MRQEIISLVDIKQYAMMQGKTITENEHTFNQQTVYKIDHMNGLYTFNELKNLFVH